jgi:hypothetical protein
MRDGDYLIDELTGCWIWQKAKAQGYGQTCHHGKVWGAHRWYYTQAKGPIPPGMWIDHLCRVKACVNPEHLEAVTPGENTRRGLNGTLSLEQIAEIETSSATAKELAARFGCTPSAIYYRRLKAEQAQQRAETNRP